MNYRVVYTERFQERVNNHVDYLLAERVSIETITAWYDRMYELLDSLDEIPKRFPVDEHVSNETGSLTRKLNYGKYVVLYTVDDDDRTVQIIEFIHGARRK
ncbi:MAG: type II toxin-antitoxin system RelE/ParE family toxin [Phycisphaeraceae bacterium]